VPSFILPGAPNHRFPRSRASPRASLKDANVKLRLADAGSEPVTQAKATPEALRVRLKSEIDKRGPIVRKTGQHAD